MIIMACGNRVILEEEEGLDLNTAGRTARTDNAGNATSFHLENRFQSYEIVA